MHALSPCNSPQEATVRILPPLNVTSADCTPDHLQCSDSSSLQAQAEVITAATLTWRQWHLNYYHGLGESVFEVHSLACKWLGYCGAANSTDLAPIFIERPGDQASWAQFLPAAESALKCLFPGPNHFIGDDRIRDKVLFRPDNWFQAEPAVQLLFVTTAVVVGQGSIVSVGRVQL